ncbi:MAG: hypothetical protein HOQ02_06385 [Lysobacter sp.]|nr:hypothetical protein [Lysobacter sp.]
MMATNQGDDMRDPRNQPAGSHDQDKHGRKQNRGSDAPGRKDALHDGGRETPGGPAHGGGSGRDRSGSLG